MLIPPKYILTPKVSQFLQSIEASCEVINSINIPHEIELNIRRQSTLKSSLFSARIEGNNTTLEELSKLPSKDQRKKEVFNILKALNWVFERNARDLTPHDILLLHRMVTEGLLDKFDSGKFRTKVSAIFNTVGIAIYLPPRPSQINPLINKLLRFINTSKEQFVPVRACLSHYIFEKIHPFLDGNGRVGRLLLQLVLAKGGYGMKGLLNLEEYLDSHRNDYYQVLNEPEKDVTDFLEFMLEAIAVAGESAKKQVLEKQKTEAEDYLLPRRAEVFNIIKDHKIMTFDNLRRRFISINQRTLRYDLKKLQDQGLIRKRGTTKGVWYELASQGPTLQG